MSSHWNPCSQMTPGTKRVGSLPCTHDWSARTTLLIYSLTLATTHRLRILSDTSPRRSGRAERGPSGEVEDGCLLEEGGHGREVTPIPRGRNPEPTEVRVPGDRGTPSLPYSRRPGTPGGVGTEGHRRGVLRRDRPPPGHTRIHEGRRT